MFFLRHGHSLLRSPGLAAGLLILAAAGLTGSTSLLAQSSSSASATDRVADWAGKSRAEVAALVPGAERDYFIPGWHGWREVELNYALVGGALPERLVKARFSFAAPVSAAQARAAAVARLGLEPEAVIQTTEADAQAAAGRRGYFVKLSAAGDPGNMTSVASGSATASVTVFFHLPAASGSR